MKLIPEKGTPGRHCHLLPDCGVPVHKIGIGRGRKLNLLEFSENEISGYYTGLVERAHGINDGFCPLGSCTMKYNSKVNKEMASLEGSASICPLQPEHTVQGTLRIFGLVGRYLCEIIGMETVTFQPATGAHGEFTDLLLMKVHHHFGGDERRTRIIVSDSAHGTNPTNATMAGYSVVSIPSKEGGCVDLDRLKETVGEGMAGLMLTNPNTVGLFNKNIPEIARIVHGAGGLCYYDGANLSAVMGIVKLGDMGFDVIHLNLHKIFPTPHGEDGPGSGPVGCKKFLRPSLPGFMVRTPGEEERCGALGFVKEPESIGGAKMFYGNFGVVVKALSYTMALGREGIPEAPSNTVLDANYMMNKLSSLYKMVYNEIRMHGFVTTPEDLKHDINMSAMDITKTLLSYGIHLPVMYFPPIVHEILMVGPTETESRETLDQTIRIFRNIHEAAKADPESLRQAPVKAAARRLDEAITARRPVLCCMGE